MATTVTSSINDDQHDQQQQLLKVSLALGAAAAILLGWKLNKWTSSRTTTTRTTAASSSSWKDWLTLRHKLVIVVRGDSAPLKISAGQMAAHCASASILAFKSASQVTPTSTLLWRLTGQAKVVVRTQSVYEFNRLAEEASKRSLASSLIKEASASGSPETETTAAAAMVLAIGPGPARLVDQVTGHLKLVR